MSKRGFFISLEGVEGVGKSTAFTYMQDYLVDRNINLAVTREPGGTDIAERIRKVLLDHHAEQMFIDTEVLLMFASRAQNISQIIRPALQKGDWVLADRYVDASFAYQGYGRDVAMDRMQQISNWVINGLLPDITILLDAPVEVGLQRMIARGKKDRIEQEGVDFFERVRNGYLQLASDDPGRYRVIDATKSIENVQNEIKSILDNLIAMVNI